MKKAAIYKSKDRLASAKAHLERLESSRDYESSRRHWYDFLLASNAVFSVLEQGSKGLNKSEYWFGGQKRQRRDDPLLCYLHHARNADEHGINPVTELDRQKIVLVEDGRPTAAIKDMIDNRGKLVHLADTPPNLKKVTEIRVYPDRAKLVRVIDRGKEYEPPTEHLGSPVDDNGPVLVAQLMVQYIEKMIDEAERLAWQG